MKRSLITIILLLAVLTVSSFNIVQQQDYNNDYERYSQLVEQNQQSYELSLQENSNNKIDALKCLVQFKDEIRDTIQLIKDIIHLRIYPSLHEIRLMLKRILPILDNCSSIFCYAPSYEKCQEENPGNECEKWGLIIYPQCQEGYTNKGCCLCRPACPAEYKTVPEFCIKPKGYHRGLGHAHKSKCEKHNPQGCQKWGLLWFPKCKEGFHNRGPYKCTPNCPEGYPDVGIACAKPLKVYGRGVGFPISLGMQCIFPNINRDTLDDFMNLDCEEKSFQMDLIMDYLEEQIQIMEQTEDYSLFDSNFVNMIYELIEKYENSEC